MLEDISLQIINQLISNNINMELALEWRPPWVRVVTELILRKWEENQHLWLNMDTEALLEIHLNKIITIVTLQEEIEVQELQKLIKRNELQSLKHKMPIVKKWQTLIKKNKS